MMFIRFRNHGDKRNDAVVYGPFQRVTFTNNNILVMDQLGNESEIAIIYDMEILTPPGNFHEYAEVSRLDYKIKE